MQSDRSLRIQESTNAKILTASTAKTQTDYNRQHTSTVHSCHIPMRQRSEHSFRFLQ